MPLTVAIHLSRNGRYEEAMRWLHYIFDPTDNGSGSTPRGSGRSGRSGTTEVQLIEDVLVNLSTEADPELLTYTLNSIAAWKDDPFRPAPDCPLPPHRVHAQGGDGVPGQPRRLGRRAVPAGHRRDRQRGVAALRARRERPRTRARRRCRAKAGSATQTYETLRDDLDAIGNALRDIEADIPFDLAPLPTGVSDDAQLAALRSVGASLYFCVPRNDKLLSYWDTVADRLFKIRNSLNIQGVFRQLPLFDPPIDPAMLARAAAAGLDVGAIVSGINQPLPLVRFRLLASRASEICQEVKSLGGQLLSAIEKKDDEALDRAARPAGAGCAGAGRGGAVPGSGRRRSRPRRRWRPSLANAVVRYTHYERLLGRLEGTISVPELDELDTVSAGADALLGERTRGGNPGGADLPTTSGRGRNGALMLSLRGGPRTDEARRGSEKAERRP